MSVDWQLYMRRPFLFALAQAAKKHVATYVAVNRPLCPLSTLVRKHHRLKEWLSPARLEPKGENLYLFSPKYFVHDSIANTVPFLESLNLAALRRSYSRLQQRLGVVEPQPIVWFHYPQQGYVAKLFPGSFSVFEIYDNLVSVTGERLPKVERLEQALRPRIDLLLTTSQALREKYAPHYRRSVLVGNGLSRRTLEQLSKEEGEEVAEIKAIPSPRIGYAGFVSNRLDWDLLNALAEAKPEWHFLFVGPVADRAILKRASRFTNLHFLGSYPYESVPAVLRSFDLGMMPYLDNEFFRFLNPLKFYELAAAGLPSVSSPIEELRQFPPELVKVVPNRVEEWIDAIEELLSVPREEVRPLGRELASQYIWEDMAEKLLEQIAGFMP